MLNIHNCTKMLRERLDYLNFEDQSSDKVGKLIAKGVHLKGFDDDIRFEFVFNENGAARATFVFDEMEPTKANYDLINDANENIGFMKCYLTERNGKHFFVMEHVAYEVLTDENAVATLVAIMRLLLQDDVKKYLRPILAITE